MKVYFIKKSIFARLLGVSAIVIYPLVFFRDSEPGTSLINHEMIHVEQIRKYGFLKFYFLYLKEYLQFRIKGMNHNDAYLAISFEKEAYKNQDKMT